MGFIAEDATYRQPPLTRKEILLRGSSMLIGGVLAVVICLLLYHLPKPYNTISLLTLSTVSAMTNLIPYWKKRRKARKIL